MSTKLRQWDDWLTLTYDAAASDGDWSHCLELLKRGLNAEFFQANLQISGCPAAPLGGGSDLPEPVRQLYYSEWYDKDPWAAAAVSAPHNVVVRGDKLCSDKEFLGSEMYNELLRPTVDLRHVMGMIMDVEDGFLVLGLLRTRDRANFTDHEGRVLARLLPHLSRAVGLARRLAQPDEGANLAASVLDQLAFGVVVADRLTRPLLVNRAAMAMIEEEDGLWLPHGRVVRGAIVAETRRLHELVRLVADNGPRHPGGAVGFSRPSGRPAYHVVVSPVPTGVAQGWPAGRALALLLIEDPALVPMPRWRVLQDLFAMSGTECDLAERLATGATLEQIAEQRGVRMTTLRTQLRSVLLKTGTDRQATLLQLLARLARR